MHPWHCESGMRKKDVKTHFRLKSIWVASEISGSLAVVVDRVSASDWKTEIWELDESSDNTDLLSGPVARIIEIIQLAAFTMGPKAKLRDSA